MSIQDQERYKLVAATEGAGSITIAAIDNGLSFPCKHPDEWRACKCTLLFFTKARLVVQ